MYFRWEFRIRAAFSNKLKPSVFSYQRLLPIGCPIFASGYHIQKNYISENVIICCFSALNGGTDAITYNGQFNITNAQPLSVTISDPSSTLGNNKYHVYKYPKTQGLKTTWYNTDLNKGSINDQVFRSIIEIGNYYYIVSRTSISVDTSVPMIFT